MVAMLFDGAIPVLANPGHEDTVAPRRGGAVAEEPLLRREREVLRFLEAQGMEKDAQLCRERLAVMTA